MRHNKVDDNGNTYRIILGIINHEKDDSAIKVGDAFITGNGNGKKNIITKNWDILIQWKDKSKSLIQLKNVRNSNLPETT